MWHVITLLTSYGLLIACKSTNKVFKRCTHIILLENTNWSNLDETFSKFLCFQTQMFSIVDIYFSSNNISTTPPIYCWFSCFGLQDFHFCLLVFMWLLVVHIFITFQLNIWTIFLSHSSKLTPKLCGFMHFNVRYTCHQKKWQRRITFSWLWIQHFAYYIEIT
jgi:hypothetical protein